MKFKKSLLTIGGGMLGGAIAVDIITRGELHRNLIAGVSNVQMHVKESNLVETITDSAKTSMANTVTAIKK